FRDDYVALDPIVSGASDYLNAVSNAGAMIAYVTGRAETTMKNGTLESFRKNGFPIKNNLLLMKPRPHDNDLEYKRGAFKKLRLLGKVVAGFENEPPNSNAYYD